MNIYLLLVTIVAVSCLCDARKHHKKDSKNEHDVKPKRPSANPYHHGSKHRGGRMRGQHLQFKVILFTESE